MRMRLAQLKATRTASSGRTGRSLVRFVNADEAVSLPLRKESSRTGTLRLVDVADYDLSACGGTHVARTGAIGIVAVGGHERFKGGTRVEFVCGGRALRAFGRQRDVLAGSVRQLSVLPVELPAAIERLQADGKHLRAEVRELQRRLARYEADALLSSARHMAGANIVAVSVEGADAHALKALAQEVTAHPGHAAILVNHGQPLAIVVARAATSLSRPARWSVSSRPALAARVAAARNSPRGAGSPRQPPRCSRPPCSCWMKSVANRRSRIATPRHTEARKRRREVTESRKSPPTVTPVRRCWRDPLVFAKSSRVPSRGLPQQPEPLPRFRA